MAASAPTPFYVGTYTHGDSQGIYRYSIHGSGRMEALGLAVETRNPSFLCRSHSQRFLLAVNEVDDLDGNGTVESFLVSGDRLKRMNRRSSGGAHPCFVTCDDQGRVFTANYSSGSIGILTLDQSGRLSEPSQVLQHTGHGTTPRQAAAHAHSVWVHAQGGDVISVDLGSNELWFWRRDTDGQFVPSKQGRLAMAPGAGPRHLAFHPNGHWIYVINELDSTLTRVVSKDTGYVRGESISTLPKGSEVENTTAHVLITADGQFLYASNRGHDSIAVFRIQGEGNLELLGHKSCGGSGPRHFVLSPDERFLVVANQHSDNLVSLKRDAATGLLRYAHEIQAPTPVNILF